MPATTTFCDIKLTENVENYRYEDEDYSWEKGDVISLPQHTANRFVNKWNRAKWAKEPYEVKNTEYDAVCGRVRDNGEPASTDEVSYGELQDLAKENDIAANQSREDLMEELDEEGVDY